MLDNEANKAKVQKVIDILSDTRGDNITRRAVVKIGKDWQFVDYNDYGLQFIENQQLIDDARHSLITVHKRVWELSATDATEMVDGLERAAYLPDINTVMWEVPAGEEDEGGESDWATYSVKM